MDDRKRPLLSICIPTHKRARLLQSSLLSVGPQIIQFEDEVELVVSDNCSPDETPEVIAEAKERFPIRYHRNDRNIGAIKNVVQLATDLAQGEFCWILGDDDLIRPGGVAKVLEVLRSNPKVDYVYVNFNHLDIKEFDAYPQPASSFDIKGDLRPGNKVLNDYPVEIWDRLIDPDISSVFLGSIQTSVVRRSVWLEHAPSLEIGTPFSNLDSTYPHIVIYAMGLVGKKAYYIGEPQIIVIDGARDWIGYVPVIVLERLHEALDLYQKMGVDVVLIEKCRKKLLITCGSSFYDLFFNPTSRGREYFHVRSFLKNYGHRIEFILGFVNRSFVSNINGNEIKNLRSNIKLARNRLFFR